MGVNSRYLFIIIVLLFLSGCKSKDDKITDLLSSTQKDDVIYGAFLASKSNNEDFVPLLLKDANDIRSTTMLKFKGKSVYQEKMIALKKIYKISPPKEITMDPDSVIICFYDSIYKSKLNDKIPRKIIKP